MKRGFLEKLIERIGLVQPGDVQNYLVEIAREKGFLETIFNTIFEGVIVTDAGGRIIYLNRAACGFFGIDAEKNGTENLPVDGGIKPFKGIARFAQTGVAVLKVK